ncbi:MAG TPA: flagellar export chaperone FliS [Porticoccaceae bacterium]|nr:flagellar export chaperone FliS [Porticoccaceae bacterium]
MSNSSLQQYRNVQAQSALEGASPHKLISMLLEGLLGNLAAAKGGVERNESSLKGEKLGRAIAIIDNLRASLDLDQGGEVAVNLRDLYDYMEPRLLKANMDNDVAIIDEVVALVRGIKEAWDAIPPDQQAPLEETGTASPGEAF